MAAALPHLPWRENILPLGLCLLALKQETIAAREGVEEKVAMDARSGTAYAHFNV